MLWLAPGAGKASRPTQHIGNEADRRTVDDTEFFQAGRWPVAGGQHNRHRKQGVRPREPVKRGSQSDTLMTKANAYMMIQRRAAARKSVLLLRTALVTKTTVKGWLGL